MTQVTPRYFFLNPYLYPSTPYLYGKGYGFFMEMQGIYIKPMVCNKTVGFFSNKQKDVTIYNTQILIILLCHLSLGVSVDCGAARGVWTEAGVTPMLLGVDVESLWTEVGQQEQMTSLHGSSFVIRCGCGQRWASENK